MPTNNLRHDLIEFILSHQEQLAQKLDHKTLDHSIKYGIFAFDLDLTERIDHQLINTICQNNIYNYVFERFQIYFIPLTHQFYADYDLLIKSLDLVKTSQEPIVFYFPLTTNISLTNPGILVSDMDMTIIQNEVIDMVADLHGVGDAVTKLTEQAMQGKMTFDQSFNSRLKLLKGFSFSKLNKLVEKINITPGFTQTIQILSSFGWKIAIASGGFKQFIELFAQKYKITDIIANDIEISDNKLTGNLSHKVIDAEAKAEFVVQLKNKYPDLAHSVIVVGDGSNDIPMMKLANYAIGIKAKPIVISHTDVNFDCTYYGLHHFLIAQEISKNLF